MESKLVQSIYISNNSVISSSLEDSYSDAKRPVQLGKVWEVFGRKCTSFISTDNRLAWDRIAIPGTGIEKGCSLSAARSHIKLCAYWLTAQSSPYNHLSENFNISGDRSSRRTTSAHYGVLIVGSLGSTLLSSYRSSWTFSVGYKCYLQKLSLPSTHWFCFNQISMYFFNCSRVVCAVRSCILKQYAHTWKQWTDVVCCYFSTLNKMLIRPRVACGTVNKEPRSDPVHWEMNWCSLL